MTNDEWKHPTCLFSLFIRKSLLVFCIVCTLFLALAAFSSPADKVVEWVMFRGSPALTGVSDAALPTPLRLRWSFQAKDSIESSAAIASGIVFFGSMDGSLNAVDLATGKQRWHYATSGPVQESSPCVRNGVVYIGDLNGVFHAVDALTGKVRWTFKTASEIKSSPSVSGNRVYFGSYDQNLYCLSTDTGALIWKYTTDGPVHSTPAIDRKHVYVSGCDETFHAIDALSGKQNYALPLGAYAGASAALRDDHAYVGTFANEVMGIDLRQRRVQWVYKHPTRSFPFYSSAAVTTDRVVLGGRDKMVHCLDRVTGKELWTFLTKARVESSPLVLGNRVFVGSNDGLLYELDLVSGKKVWDFTAGAPLSASPGASQGSLVIGSQDGVLYCFGN
jgi:eukaryotic-like serine/threonine-protein kinase